MMEKPNEILMHFQDRLKELQINYRGSTREVFIEYRDTIEHPRAGVIYRYSPVMENVCDRWGEVYYRRVSNLLRKIQEKLPKDLIRKCYVSKIFLLIAEESWDWEGAIGFSDIDLDVPRYQHDYSDIYASQRGAWVTEGTIEDARRIAAERIKGLHEEHSEVLKIIRHFNRKLGKEFSVDYKDQIQHPTGGKICRLKHQSLVEETTPEYYERMNKVLEEIRVQLPTRLRKKCYVSTIYVLIKENSNWRFVTDYWWKNESHGYRYDYIDKAWIVDDPRVPENVRIWESEDIKGKRFY